MTTKVVVIMGSSSVPSACTGRLGSTVRMMVLSSHCWRVVWRIRLLSKLLNPSGQKLHYFNTITRMKIKTFIHIRVDIHLLDMGTAWMVQTNAYALHVVRKTSQYLTSSIVAHTSNNTESTNHMTYSIGQMTIAWNFLENTFNPANWVVCLRLQ